MIAADSDLVNDGSGRSGKEGSANIAWLCRRREQTGWEAKGEMRSEAAGKDTVGSKPAEQLKNHGQSSRLSILLAFHQKFPEVKMKSIFPGPGGDSIMVL